MLSVVTFLALFIFFGCIFIAIDWAVLILFRLEKFPKSKNAVIFNQKERVFIVPHVIMPSSDFVALSGFSQSSRINPSYHIFKDINDFTNASTVSVQADMVLSNF